MRASGFRRLVLVAILASVSAMVWPVAAPAQEGLLGSGAVGLTRGEVEVRWGSGSGPYDGPGFYFNVYDLYTYAAQNATYAVGYQDTNGREIAVYVEVAWFGDVSEQEARSVVAGLLPADAERTELYVAPPTPGGATALVTYRYESASLDAAYDGILAGEVLVTYQERWSDAGPPDGSRVRAVSLMVRTITQ